MIASLTAATGGSTVPTAVISLVITALVLLWILYRQVQVRPVRTSWVVPLVLVIAGVAALTSGSGGGHRGLTATAIAVLIALLVLDAAGLGAVRALTVRLWREGGTVVRRGTWVTVLLWLVGLGVHLGVDAVARISDSSALLYLGVTLAAQRLVLQARAGDPGRLADHPPGRASPPRATSPESS